MPSRNRKVIAASPRRRSRYASWSARCSLAAQFSPACIKSGASVAAKCIDFAHLFRIRIARQQTISPRSNECGRVLRHRGAKQQRWLIGQRVQPCVDDRHPSCMRNRLPLEQSRVDACALGQAGIPSGVRAKGAYYGDLRGLNVRQIETLLFDPLVVSIALRPDPYSIARSNWIARFGLVAVRFYLFRFLLVQSC